MADENGLAEALGVETPASEQPAESAAFDWDAEVEVNGFDTPVKLSELRDGYMRHADYTQKTQALASDREDYELFRSFRDEIETDPQGTLNKIAKEYGWSLSEVQQAAAEAAGLDPELKAELDELRTFRSEWASEKEAREQARIQQEITNDLARLREERGEYDEVALIDYAVKHGIADLSVALDAMEGSAARQKGFEEGKKLAVGRIKATPESAGADRGSAPVASTFEEIWNAKKAELTS